MHNMYGFDWDCGRHGSLEGIFFATAEEVERAIGQHLNFGEALGKHSEINGTLELGEITKLDVPPADLEVLLRYQHLIASGFDPLDVVQCSECEDRSGRVNEAGLCSFCAPEKGA